MCIKYIIVVQLNRRSKQSMNLKSVKIHESFNPYLKVLRLPLDLKSGSTERMPETDRDEVESVRCLETSVF